MLVRNLWAVDPQHVVTQKSLCILSPGQIYVIAACMKELVWKYFELILLLPKINNLHLEGNLEPHFLV